MYRELEVWYSMTMPTTGDARAAERARMTEFFDSVSYVDDFTDTFPEVPAEDPSDGDGSEDGSPQPTG